MSKSTRFDGTDGLLLVLAIAIGGSAALFRQMAIVPRATVGICAASPAPGFCGPRELVLKLQYFHGFGWVALGLGLLAFSLGNRLAAAFAIGIGAAAVVNYNATYGIIGVAFGLFAWLGINTGRFQTSS
jgi:hypothetical protein